MIVAIDGPSGSGKSSVAREIARRCGLTYLDTGAMYRSVAYACLERGVDPEDADAVAEVARDVRIEFTSADDGQRVLVDGVDATAQIRTPEVERAVSPVSANPRVRETMVALQRAAGERAVLADLVRRDEYDSSREASPLRAADDAHRIDSSELGFEEVVSAILALLPELAARAEGRAS